MFTLDLQGLPALTQAFQQLATQARQAMAEAVQAEAERILEASYPDVPVDTGLLLATGLVEAKPDGAEISYGGRGLAPYAILVHESVEMNHPNGGTHHYLSKSFFAALNDMPQRLGEDIRQRLRIP